MRLSFNRSIAAALSVFLAWNVTAFCQETDTQTGFAATDHILEGWGRWSAKLNLADLAFTIPNLGVEFDLSTDKYSKKSLNLTTRYSWNGWHTYQPYVVMNLLDIRPEYRSYVRGLQRTKTVFYWGIYGSGGTYSMKFNDTGHQGYMFGTGVSFGWVLPLHEYKRFAIDFEFGGSLGLLFRNQNAFRRSDDGMAYVMLPEEYKGLSIVPFPVISEARAALVFRKVSVRQRYQLTTDETTALRRKNIEKNEKRKKAGKKNDVKEADQE